MTGLGVLTRGGSHVTHGIAAWVGTRDEKSFRLEWDLKSDLEKATL